MFGILLAISLLALASFTGATEIPPGASCLGDPVAVSRSPNITDLFVVGGDGYVYTASMMPGDKTYGGWWNIPGFQAKPCAPIAAVSRSRDHLDIFAVGTNSYIYTAAWEPDFGGWRGWWQVSGFQAHDNYAIITAVSRDTDKLDIFSVGTDSNVFTTGWQAESGWASWQKIGSLQTSGHTEVSVVSRSPGLMDIFAPDTNGNVYTAAWTGTSWAGWWAVAGGKTGSSSSVAAVSRSANKLDAFIVGTDGRVWTAAWQPGFNGFRGWWSIGSATFPMSSPITAISRAQDVLTVFIMGGDNRVYTASWTPRTGWVDWQPIAGYHRLTQGQVGAVSMSNDRLDIFAKTGDSATNSAGGWKTLWQVETWVQKSESAKWCDMYSVMTVEQGGCLWY